MKTNFLYISLQRVKKVILEDLRNIAIAERFNKLEYVKRVYLHTDLLTIESGLLTPTMKAKVSSKLKSKFTNVNKKQFIFSDLKCKDILARLSKSCTSKISYIFLSFSVQYHFVN